MKALSFRISISNWAIKMNRSFYSSILLLLIFVNGLPACVTLGIPFKYTRKTHGKRELFSSYIFHNNGEDPIEILKKIHSQLNFDEIEINSEDNEIRFIDSKFKRFSLAYFVFNSDFCLFGLMGSVSLKRLRVKYDCIINISHPSEVKNLITVKCDEYLQTDSHLPWSNSVATEKVESENIMEYQILSIYAYELGELFPVLDLPLYLPMSFSPYRSAGNIDLNNNNFGADAY